MSDIIGINGKVLKSKFKKDLEARTFRSMMAMAVCRGCGYEWIALITVPQNLFRLECLGGCGAKESFCSIVPREYERNFTEKMLAVDAEEVRKAELDATMEKA
jgi:hypothetical protein